LKGDYDTASEILDTDVEILGSKHKINYHPYDGMGGVDYYALKSQLEKTVFADGGAIGSGKNGYVAFYKGKRIEVYANTMYEAQKTASQHFKARKDYDVNVVLAEVDGKPYINSTMFADGGSFTPNVSDGTAFMDNAYFAKGGTLKKYIDHADIKYVALMIKGSRTIVKGSDVLNGANLLEDGGDLSKIAFYVPKRDVISVTLNNGKTIKPVNGYWVKKDYKAISGSGGNNTPKPVSANSASKIDETKAHFKIENGEVFVDSNFVNQCQNNLPNSELKHYGFGEFYLDTPDGQIDFARKEDKTEGFVGRTHKLRGDNELILKLIKAMSEKGRFESGQKLPKFQEEPKQVASASTSSGSDLTKLKKGDRVLLKDGSSTREATVTEDGLDSQKRVRVRPNGFPFDISVTLEENNKTYVIKKLMSGGYFANGGGVGSYDVVIDGDWDEPKKFKTFSLAKKWIYENIKNHNSLELVDAYGDTIYVEGNSTKEDLDWLFSNDSVSFADGGSTGSGFDPVKVKVVMAVGLDSAIEFYDADYPIRPVQLLERAVRGGYITLDEINERVVDSAMETAQDSEDMEEVGSSDFGAYLRDFLDEAGFKVGYVNGRLTREFADGGSFAPNASDGTAFMDNAYFADGGEIRRYNRQKEMNAETREEVLDVVSEPNLSGVLTNYLYGLFDGYDYSQTERFKEEMSKLKSKDSDLHNKINAIYKKIDKYKFEKYDDYADGGFMNDVYAKGGSADSLSVNKASILSATKKCTDGDSDRSTCQSGNFEVTMVYDYGTLDLDFVYLDYNNPRFNPSKEHYASYSFTKGGKGVLTDFDQTVYTKQGRRTDAKTIISKTIDVLKSLGYPVDSIVDSDGEEIQDAKYADGGMFDDNDGFMKADNNRNFRYPEMEVYVETFDEPIDLTSNVSSKTNNVVVRPLNEDIDLSDDGRIRARMTQSHRGSAESFSKINPRAFEFIGKDLPTPTSHTHKND
jgi:hypothetical protein